MNKVLLYGKHPVKAALNNQKRKIKKIYVTGNLSKEYKHYAREKKLNLEIVEKKYIDKMTNFANHQNIVLECSTIFQEGFSPKSIQTNRILILDQITDPHNIGAIIRSACAFNFFDIIIPENSCPEENGTIAKSSVGAIEQVNIYVVKNIANTMKRLKEDGFWAIGLDSHAKNTVSDFDFPQKCAFILGSEGKGMRDLVKKSCDINLRIPMNQQSESLNVSCAASIILYHFDNYAFKN